MCSQMIETNSENQLASFAASCVSSTDDIYGDTTAILASYSEFWSVKEYQTGPGDR